MRDDPGAPCPNCGAAATRQFFPAGIVVDHIGQRRVEERCQRQERRGQSRRREGRLRKVRLLEVREEDTRIRRFDHHNEIRFD
jgi:hypothetical protein